MNASLLDDWLELATTHAVTAWLKTFLRRSLPPLVAQQITATEFAASLDSLLEARKLATPSQQKNPRSNIVQALKSFDSNIPRSLSSLYPLRNIAPLMISSADAWHKGKLNTLPRLPLSSFSIDDANLALSVE